MSLVRLTVACTCFAFFLLAHFRNNFIVFALEYAFEFVVPAFAHVQFSPTLSPSVSVSLALSLFGLHRRHLNYKNLSRLAGAVFIDRA